jgi:hypothetical protein
MAVFLLKLIPNGTNKSATLLLLLQSFSSFYTVERNFRENIQLPQESYFLLHVALYLFLFGELLKAYPETSCVHLTIFIFIHGKNIIIACKPLLLFMTAS